MHKYLAFSSVPMSAPLAFLKCRGISILDIFKIFFCGKFLLRVRLVALLGWGIAELAQLAFSSLALLHVWMCCVCCDQCVAFFSRCGFAVESDQIRLSLVGKLFLAQGGQLALKSQFFFLVSLVSLWSMIVPLITSKYIYLYYFLLVYNSLSRHTILISTIFYYAQQI